MDSGLRDSLKALAHAILRRVDRHSWQWPRQRGARGGVTVAELADGAGLSRRHTARCLRDLEDQGLVRTTFRPFEVSEYRLEISAWRHLAEAHKARKDRARAEKRAERLARFEAWRQARGGAARPAPVVDSPAPAPAATPRTPTAPFWAVRHARRVGSQPETVFSLVGGVARVILDPSAEGPKPEPHTQGALARPVLRLWEDRGRPSAAQLEAELQAICRWSAESVHPEAAHLRASVARPGPQGGAVHLLHPKPYGRRLQLARAHATAAEAAREAGQEGQAPAPPALPGPDEAPWVPPGQRARLPGLGPPPTDLGGRWRAALGQLRTDEEQERGSIDIFFAPLQPLGVRDGVVVVQAPSPDCARWIADHLSEPLAALSDALGWPIGFVVA